VVVSTSSFQGKMARLVLIVLIESNYPLAIIASVRKIFGFGSRSSLLAEQKQSK
jgi:hypothetical protein